MRIGFEIILHPHAAKARAFGKDLSSGAPTELRRAQHVLPRSGGLLEYLRIDLPIE